jgi:rhodanese-related sulfurtransferase
MTSMTRRALLIGAALLAVAATSYAARWELVKQQIAAKFPEIPSITTAEHAAVLADKHAEKPLLIEVRTRAEFDVSHLQGAHHVEPDSEPAQLKLALAKQAPIVTYCAVGYRSAAFARRLRAAGFTNVRNLEGSIFQWANEDRPLVKDGKPAQTVHPYDGVWGSLLKEEKREKIPSAK